MTPPTSDEYGAVRAVVAKAIYDTAKVGRGTTDNGLRLCGEVADAVLDALGLAQVGWYSPTGGAFWLGVHGVRGAEAVPVYRLTALGSSEAGA